MTWGQTVSGKPFDYFDPKVEQIDLNDMCRALDRVNRFCGHTIRPYSVAEHSLLVSLLVDKADRMQALCHDLTEAYMGDIPGPLKKQCCSYRVLEENLHKVICQALRIDPVIPEAVHVADKQALHIESDALMPPLPRPFEHPPKHRDHDTLVGHVKAGGGRRDGYYGEGLESEIRRLL